MSLGNRTASKAGLPASPHSPSRSFGKSPAARIGTRSHPSRPSASLQGFTLAAYVYAHASGGFGYSVLVDCVHVPGSPGRQINSLEEAARRAKGQFERWAVEILQRV
jgi:hypothetical protein